MRPDRFFWMEAGDGIPETLPVVGRDQCVMAGPHWVFNARVDLGQDGKISVLPASDQMNGDLGRRFKDITEALPRYYRCTGDRVVLGQLKIAPVIHAIWTRRVTSVTCSQASVS
jgi:hypothetical protein